MCTKNLFGSLAQSGQQTSKIATLRDWQTSLTSFPANLFNKIFLGQICIFPNFPAYPSTVKADDLIVTWHFAISSVVWTLKITMLDWSTPRVFIRRTAGAQCTHALQSRIYRNCISNQIIICAVLIVHGHGPVELFRVHGHAKDVDLLLLCWMEKGTVWCEMQTGADCENKKGLVRFAP